MATGEAASKFFVVSLCLILMLLITLWISGYEDISRFSLHTRKNPDSYSYQLGNNTVIRGLPFYKHEEKRTFPSYYIDINKYDLSNFTFITGSSSNHFMESKDLIASIQKVFPWKQIYYYDLGLKKKEIKEMETWCGVIYREWRSDGYPKHARTMHSYAFKPLIIYEAIQTFNAIFWLDASGRLSPKVNHKNWNSVYDVARKTDGIVQFDNTGRDTFQCTNKGMYRYLPADEEKLKTFNMIGAGIVLLYRTERVFNKILYWWRLCALTKDCIEPKGHKINCGKNHPGVSICHRYDQSALNILIANMLNYEGKTIPKGKRIIEVQRHPTNFYNLTTECDKIVN